MAAWSFDIETYGIGDVLVNTLNGVAIFTDFAQNPPLVSLLKLVAVSGLIYAVIAAMNGREGTSPLKYLIFMGLALGLLFGPRANVTVMDKWGTNSLLSSPGSNPNLSVVGTVNNVPLSLAIIAYVANAMDKYFIQMTDTLFSGLSGGSAASDGFLSSLELANKAKSLTIEDAGLRNKTNAYIEQCVGVVGGWFPGFFTFLAHSKNLLQDIDVVAYSTKVGKKVDPVVTLTNLNGTTTSLQCSALYNQIKTGLTQKLRGGKSALEHQFEALVGVSSARANDFLLAMASKAMTTQDSAAHLALMRVMESKGYFRPGDVQNLTQTQAGVLEMQKGFKEGAMKLAAEFGREALPMLKAVLFALMIAIFPFAAVLFLLPGGMNVFKNYSKGIIWLSLWGPLMIILNGMANMISEKIFRYYAYHSNDILAQAGNLTPVKGFVVNASWSLMDLAVNASELAMFVIGVLSLSVPRLAYMLLSSGQAIVSDLMSSMNRPVQQSMDEHAQGNARIAEIEEDNVRKANVSIGGDSQYGSTLAMTLGAQGSMAGGHTVDTSFTDGGRSGQQHTDAVGTTVSKSSLRHAVSQFAHTLLAHQGTSINSEGSMGANINTGVDDRYLSQEIGAVSDWLKQNAQLLDSSGDNLTSLTSTGVRGGVGSHAINAMGTAVLAGGVAAAVRSGWLTKGADGQAVITNAGRGALQRFFSAETISRAEKAGGMALPALAAIAAASLVAGADSSAVDSKSQSHSHGRSDALGTGLEIMHNVQLQMNRDSHNSLSGSIGRSVKENEITGQNEQGGETTQAAEDTGYGAVLDKKDLDTLAHEAFHAFTVQNSHFTNRSASISLNEQRLLAREVMMRGERPNATRTDHNRAVLLQMLEGVVNRNSAGSVEAQNAIAGIHYLLADAASDYANERLGLQGDDAFSPPMEDVAPRVDRAGSYAKSGRKLVENIEDGLKQQYDANRGHKAEGPATQDALAAAGGADTTYKNIKGDINKAKSGLTRKANDAKRAYHVRSHDMFVNALMSIGISRDEAERITGYIMPTLTESGNSGAARFLQYVDDRSKNKKQAVLNMIDRAGHQVLSNASHKVVQSLAEKGQEGLDDARTVMQQGVQAYVETGMAKYQATHTNASESDLAHHRALLEQQATNEIGADIAQARAAALRNVVHNTGATFGLDENVPQSQRLSHVHEMLKDDDYVASIEEKVDAIAGQIKKSAVFNPRGDMTDQEARNLAFAAVGQEFARYVGGDKAADAAMAFYEAGDQATSWGSEAKMFAEHTLGQAVFSGTIHGSRAAIEKVRQATGGPKQLSLFGETAKVGGRMLGWAVTLGLTAMDAYQVSEEANRRSDEAHSVGVVIENADAKELKNRLQRAAATLTVRDILGTPPSPGNARGWSEQASDAFNAVTRGSPNG